jgi:hypothetical protein
MEMICYLPLALILSNGNEKDKCARAKKTKTWCYFLILYVSDCFRNDGQLALSWQLSQANLIQEKLNLIGFQLHYAVEIVTT